MKAKRPTQPVIKKTKPLKTAPPAKKSMPKVKAKPANKDALDRDLDAYMMQNAKTAAGKLDADLEEYMAARMDLDE